MSSSIREPALSGRAEPPTAPTSPRRSLSERQAETVEKLLDCALLEVREQGFDGLRVRSVAKRANVAPATAYTYFASKEHLVTELFWKKLLSSQAPPESSSYSGGGAAVSDPASRVAAALAATAELAMEEPELASACTTAMLATDAEVGRVRLLIGAHTHSLVSAAAGDSATPEQLQTFEAAWSGLMLQAGIGHIDYSDLAEAARVSAEVIFSATAETDSTDQGNRK